MYFKKVVVLGPSDLYPGEFNTYLYPPVEYKVSFRTMVTSGEESCRSPTLFPHFDNINKMFLRNMA